jgi:hypothetical protein
MALQGRNEICGCGRGRKYKKCCGRFTFQEMLDQLSAYAAANRQKNKLIERSLKFLKRCEVNTGGALLILVNPVTKEDIVSWTCIGGSKVPQDEREAVVTRRVLAGYLPIGCLVEDKSEESGWVAAIDATLVEEEYRDEFVAFAHIEADTIAKTFKGEMSKENSWMMAVPWGDLSFPGMPPKPRPAGTIRIEVNIPKRIVTTVWERLGAMEFPINEEYITDNELNDVIDTARHLVAALERFDPPERLVAGDKIEIYQVVSDGTPKLIAVTEIRSAPFPLGNTIFDVGET